MIGSHVFEAVAVIVDVNDGGSGVDVTASAFATFENHLKHEIIFAYSYQRRINLASVSSANQEAVHHTAHSSQRDPSS